MQIKIQTLDIFNERCHLSKFQALYHFKQWNVKTSLDNASTLTGLNIQVCGVIEYQFLKTHKIVKTNGCQDQSWQCINIDRFIHSSVWSNRILENTQNCENKWMSRPVLTMHKDYHVKHTLLLKMESQDWYWQHLRTAKWNTH